MRFLLLCLLLIPQLSYADVKKTVETVTSTDSVTQIAVPSTYNIYTKSFSLQNNDTAQPVGVMYKATSLGVVNLKLQAQQSYQRPTAEAAADASYVVWENVETVSDQAWHAVTLDTVIMPYARFNITGVSGNDNTTTIQIKVGKQ